MRTFFVLFCFPITGVFAQFDISIHAGGGASMIYNTATVNMNHLAYGSPIRSIPKRSFELGLSFRKYFGSTFLESGVVYSYIQSLHRENTIAEVPPNGWVEEIHIEKMRHIGYLGIPVLWSKNYKNFNIGAGLQPQFALDVKEDKTMWIQTGLERENVEPILTNRTIRTFDLGFISQANLEASFRISLNFKLYWGLTNTNNFQEKGVMYEFYQVESPVVDRRLKNRQFVITLQYKLVRLPANLPDFG